MNFIESNLQLANKFVGKSNIFKSSSMS